MDEAVGVIGQAVLVVAGLALLAVLALFLFWSIRLATRLCRDIWPPRRNLPSTGAYVPEAFDRMRRN